MCLCLFFFLDIFFVNLYREALLFFWFRLLHDFGFVCRFGHLSYWCFIDFVLVYIDSSFVLLHKNGSCDVLDCRWLKEVSLLIQKTAEMIYQRYMTSKMISCW